MNNDKILAGLESQFPKLCEISRGMENVDSPDMYNPQHPCRWSKLQESVLPAADLRRLSVQIAIENPERWSDLKAVRSERWKRFGTVAKEIAVFTNWIGKDILELGNHFDLRDFMFARCPHLVMS
jgi:hypothetical protein